MSRREAILDRHRATIRSIAAKNKATAIALAGSVARGTDTPESDCDFVCEFSSDATLLDFAGLQLDLADLLGCNVDIVDARALKAPFVSMLDDAVPL
ncbi:nucleotidyltransferase family protein [Candidatus Poriferisodalis sp.]|uniref:nucleotidyltransferase family protein n=1 Tax=Candidatus Poriferisodalis sp. TaxID=3101277 RepID=UPI003D0D3B8A